MSAPPPTTMPIPTAQDAAAISDLVPSEHLLVTVMPHLHPRQIQVCSFIFFLREGDKSIPNQSLTYVNPSKSTAATCGINSFQCQVGSSGSLSGCGTSTYGCCCFYGYIQDGSTCSCAAPTPSPSPAGVVAQSTSPFLNEKI